MLDELSIRTIWQIVQALLILLIALVFVKIFDKLLFKIVGAKTESRKNILRNVKRFIQLIVYIVALVLVLWIFEVDITGLLAGLGVGALIIGFALKDFIENWVSGLLIVTTKTYKTGDIIQVGNLKGIVTEVSLRTTSLKTYDRNTIVIPNSLLLREKIVNLTDGQKEIVTSITVQIDYIFNIDKAKNLIESVLRSHPNIIVNEKRKREIRFLVRVKEWITEIEPLFWIRDPIKEEFIKSEITQLVKKRLEEEKILPPFPSIIRKEHMETKK
jgi:small conductance mechanosensitive channel